MNRANPRLLFADGDVIDGEITKQRTQADIAREWRAAKARAQETIAAVREQSSEDRAAAQVARDLREMADVVAVYRREQQAIIDNDRREQEERKRKYQREQDRRAGLIRAGDIPTMIEAALEIERGIQSEAIGSAMVEILRKGLGPDKDQKERRQIFDRITAGLYDTTDPASRARH
jgi:hypothetical protein